MFYSSQILARKGPLGIVWIAAHIDGQLKRNQVRERDASLAASSKTSRGQPHLSSLPPLRSSK